MTPAAAAAGVIALSSVAGLAGLFRHTPPPLVVTSAQISTAQAAVSRLTVAARHPVAGYDRSCRRGRACSFGPAWSDATSAPLGGNGCGTRDDILVRDLHDPVRRGRCVVVAGDLNDPYTGAHQEFIKSDTGEVQIDHVIALRWAWDMGAWAWPQTTRDAFANDPRNLYATRAATNLVKSDDGPADWLTHRARTWPWRKPVTVQGATGACNYAVAATITAATYHLAVTPADQAALATALDRCAT